MPGVVYNEREGVGGLTLDIPEPRHAISRDVSLAIGNGEAQVRGSQSAHARVLTRAGAHSAFVRIGLVPHDGLYYTLPCVVGAQRAKALALTGSTVWHREALADFLARRPPRDRGPAVDER